ncbi:hypothetical protein HPB52_013800 [Rhipicephalus sanguineus]|uniref:Myb-like domain-containing protein n=1 Tax=Rhipicephalus sanguineus TaxID=34632 RepID=A0A9D4TA61_RHISA|nr:hypothetical protein HPB52_013800 [Rhipicephalus sanguineus]
MKPRPNLQVDDPCVIEHNPDIYRTMTLQPAVGDEYLESDQVPCLSDLVNEDSSEFAEAGLYTATDQATTQHCGFQDISEPICDDDEPESNGIIDEAPAMGSPRSDETDKDVPADSGSCSESLGMQTQACSFTPSLEDCLLKNQQYQAELNTAIEMLEEELAENREKQATMQKHIANSKKRPWQLAPRKRSKVVFTYPYFKDINGMNGVYHSPLQCELMWKNYLSGDNSPWTTDEDAKLAALVKKLGLHDWDEVASQMGGKRTAFQCAERHMQKSNNCLKTGYKNSFAGNVMLGEWSPAEDVHLLEVIKKHNTHRRALSTLKKTELADELKLRHISHTGKMDKLVTRLIEDNKRQRVSGTQEPPTMQRDNSNEELASIQSHCC